MWYGRKRQPIQLSPIYLGSPSIWRIMIAQSNFTSWCGAPRLCVCIWPLDRPKWGLHWMVQLTWMWKECKRIEIGWGTVNRKESTIMYKLDQVYICCDQLFMSTYWSSDFSEQISLKQVLHGCIYHSVLSRSRTSWNVSLKAPATGPLSYTTWKRGAVGGWMGGCGEFPCPLALYNHNCQIAIQTMGHAGYNLSCSPYESRFTFKTFL